MTTDTEHASAELPPPIPAVPAASESRKTFLATWLLSLLLGILAVDRFYLGKVGTGILKLITFGGGGIWYLIDLILTLAGSQKDKQGLRLAGYAQHKKIAWIVTGIVLALSIITGAVNGGNAGQQVADAPRTTNEQTTDAVAQPAAEAPVEETENVHSWADEAFGTFEPITQSGAGDNLVTLPEGATIGIVTATHDGARNFIINVLDAANGPTGDLLINTIGPYSGVTAFGFNTLSEGTTLEINADGNWSITISPISAAPALAASGVGDAVYLFDGSSGKLTASHAGSRNFIVAEETGKAFSPGLLINDIGTYSGTVPLSSGPSVISVKADGGWTMLAE
ncbi:TM2 domain-containing protein [Homoserinimonas aerilata]|uniref:TM2 domain-containing protein n=1 Tax=Homoserinimonas aerilata TaxID=1162970 RepID=A0A542YGG9_9MICO|nr:TM2 domain-containing protein [Homoserinimonas aerilata]TQL47156.1 TM2 domain-containing protein [Homoserinimonas aerilata]